MGMLTFCLYHTLHLQYYELLKTVGNGFEISGLYGLSQNKIIFESIDKKKLLPEYLMLWFGRTEFQRSTSYYATGSVRDTFNFDLMKEVEIPIPDIEVQESIANIYNTYITRKKINEQLKAQIKDICPILIRGSLEDK